MAHTIKTETRRLPVKLTNAEKITRGEELADTIERIATEEARAEMVKKELKATMALHEAERSRLAGIVRSGSEPRDVDVDIVLTDDGKVETVRLDINETISVRAATDDEKQFALDIDDD